MLESSSTVRLISLDGWDHGCHGSSLVHAWDSSSTLDPSPLLDLSMDAMEMMALARDGENRAEEGRREMGVAMVDQAIETTTSMMRMVDDNGGEMGALGLDGGNVENGHEEGGIEHLGGQRTQRRWRWAARRQERGRTGEQQPWLVGGGGDVSSNGGKWWELMSQAAMAEMVATGRQLLGGERSGDGWRFRIGAMAGLCGGDVASGVGEVAQVVVGHERRRQLKRWSAMVGSVAGKRRRQRPAPIGSDDGG